MSFFFPIDTTLARLSDLENELWGSQDAGSRRNNKQVQQAGSSTGLVRPRMDWVNKGDKTVITLELPGVAKDKVDVSLHDNVLTVSGSTSSQEEHKGEGGYLVQERRYGSFSRSISVPQGLKEDEIKASMADGVLTLEMPAKPKESEHKKISIA
ncbi:hypothetical protein ACM66B_001610 [Microbotryomycetes sp. NB124-2]